MVIYREFSEVKIHGIKAKPLFCHKVTFERNELNKSIRVKHRDKIHKKLRNSQAGIECINSRIDEFAKCWVKFVKDFPNSRQAVYQQATQELAKILNLN